jgi:RNA polymerase sigma-70 factor, ECF subfamily
MTETENILTTDSRDAADDGALSSRIGDQAQVSRELFANMAGLRLKLARVTRNPELAADILQDAIVTALQKLNAGELSARRVLDGFVYRVALNHLRNHQRKDKSLLSDQNAAAELPDPHTHCMTESLQSAQWARVMRELLMEVKPLRDRELLVRFYLHEESKEQLCQLFGLSDLHFNRVIFRARERFRELLSRRGLGRADFLSILAVF